MQKNRSQGEKADIVRAGQTLQNKVFTLPGVNINCPIAERADGEV